MNPNAPPHSTERRISAAGELGPLLRLLIEGFGDIAARSQHRSRRLDTEQGESGPVPLDEGRRAGRAGFGLTLGEDPRPGQQARSRSYRRRARRLRDRGEGRSGQGDSLENDRLPGFRGGRGGVHGERGHDAQQHESDAGEWTKHLSGPPSWLKGRDAPEWDLPRPASQRDATSGAPPRETGQSEHVAAGPAETA